jgi:cell division protease FtsH
VPRADNVNLDAIAGTIGFSGADLRNLVNEAALNAARDAKSQVDADDFDAAKDRVLMGPKREEILNDKEGVWRLGYFRRGGRALSAPP